MTQIMGKELAAVLPTTGRSLFAGAAAEVAAARRVLANLTTSKLHHSPSLAPRARRSPYEDLTDSQSLR